MSLLKVEKLTMQFGGLTAVNAVDLSVAPSQVYSVIGPNGAGKTTLFNAITGVYEPTSGTVTFDDKQLAKPFTAKTILTILLLGLFAGALALIIVVGADTLWKVSIRNNMPANRTDPFDYSKAFSSATAFISERSKTTFFEAFGTELPRLYAAPIGFVIGAFGYYMIWSRARRTTDVIALEGIARTFQNIRLFQNMTVLENVLIGLDRSYGKNPLRMAFRTPGLKREEKSAIDKASGLLSFMKLDGVKDTLAKNLPYGDQRRLEIARAMACEPKLLLLDEPAAGMNPRETTDLMELIHRIRERGITILLIEHHMSLVMGISDRIAVLDYGVKIAEGTPEEVRANPKVIEAYLGKEEVS